MSRDDLLELLRELRDHQHDQGHWPDPTHREADRLLIDYINDVEIAEVFDDIFKWYA